MRSDRLKQATSPISPAGLSCTSTRASGFGRSPAEKSVSSSVLVSPKQASLICKSIISDIQCDMAVVTVTALTHGRVLGCLEWGTLTPKEVEFTFREIKPGYAVVGDVVSGPDLFKKVCWKLKSVNAHANVALSAICKGDRVLLETPIWAMERLGLGADFHTAPEAPKTSSAPTAKSAVEVVVSRKSVESQEEAASREHGTTPGDDEPPGASAASLFGSTTPGTGTRPTSEQKDEQAPQGGLGSLEFEVVPAGRSSFRAPEVPRLDLHGLHGTCARRRSWASMPPVSNCYEECPMPDGLLDHQGRCKGFLHCQSLWRCL